MADINNLTEINENFTTIKTLLNSIRAQGVLNTSDVDKLLTGINTKLEKINTEEDIDLIKIFLTELKQNLDERHSLLISKFGAIESLFTNLLKNSAESIKSSEIKELFDIVATNLSVFSREVVSQKDSLTDIMLRLDAIRSDDSQKKDIIKSITILKNDIERLNNGFDSTILNLNENFKTILKTISSIDYTDSIKQFGKEIDNVTNSTNTILSALQVLDKKNVQIENAIKPLAQQEDVNIIKRALSDLSLKNQDVANSVQVLGEKYYKLDNLAEKIDASVSIIAGLKAVFSDNTDQAAQKILDEIAILDAQVKAINSDDSFEKFKVSLESVFNNISNETLTLKNHLIASENQLKNIADALKSIDVITGFQNIISDLNKQEHSIKEHVENNSDRLSQLIEINTTRTINDISNSAEALASQLKEAGINLSDLCNKNFTNVITDIEALKNVLNQVDENNASANNAIFSNITDRLTIFEKSLKESLEKQESFVSNSSSQLIEEIAGLKNISSMLDYKIDSSVMQLGESKKSVNDLKTSIDDLLAVDFSNIIKDLRVDLYASKQDIVNALDNSNSDLSEKITNDFFSKYELLISRIDNLEDTLKNAQIATINNLKPTLEQISSSLVDVISYVSEKNNYNQENIDVRLADITEAVKDTSLNYVENVRDIVEIAREQIESNLIQFNKTNSEKVDTINTTIVNNTDKLKEEIKFAYNKLLEVQDDFKLLNASVDLNSTKNTTNYEDILKNTNFIRQDFEQKIANLKNSLVENITDFKQDLTCDNADKISELKFISENLHQKNIQNSFELKNELKIEILQIIDTLRNNVQTLSEQLSTSVLNIEGSNNEVISYIRNDFYSMVDDTLTDLKSNLSDNNEQLELHVESISNNVNVLNNAITNLSNSTTNSLTSTLAQILDNFVSLKAIITNFNDQYTVNLDNNIEKIISDFTQLKNIVEDVDRNIDEDLTLQLSIIEKGFENIAEQIENSFVRNENIISNALEVGLLNINTTVQSSLNERLDDYKTKIEHLFNNLTQNNNSQNELLINNVEQLNSTFESALSKQQDTTKDILENISNELKVILQDNFELTNVDYEALKERLSNCTKLLDETNAEFLVELKSQIANISNNLNTQLNTQTAEVTEKVKEISYNFEAVSSAVSHLNANVQDKINNIKVDLLDFKNSIMSTTDKNSNIIVKNVEELLSELTIQNENIKTALNNDFITFTSDFSNNIDKLEGNILNIESNFITSLNNANTNLSNEFVNAISGIVDKSDENKTDIIENIFNLNEHISLHQNKLSDLLNEAKDEIEESLSKELQVINKNITDVDTNHNTSIKNINISINEKINKIQECITNEFAQQDNNILLKSNTILDELNIIKNGIEEQMSCLNSLLSTSISQQVEDLQEKFNSLFESNSLNLSNLINNTETVLAESIAIKIEELKSCIDTIVGQINEGEISKINLIKSQYENLNNSLNQFIEETKVSTKNELTSTSENLLANYNQLLEELEQNIDKNINAILVANADISAGELRSMEAFTNSILDKIEFIDKNSIQYKNSLEDFINKSAAAISDNIEKETDIIVKDLLEQAEAIRQAQKDELTKLTVHIESSIEDYIYNHINELKSYLDVKTNDTELLNKLDNLSSNLSKNTTDVISNINKMLEANIFENSISEIKVANEILITNMSNKLSSEINTFVKENSDEKLEKLQELFDDKFTKQILSQIDKIKDITEKHKNDVESFIMAEKAILAEVITTKNDIHDAITEKMQYINNSIDVLTANFDDLKAQILNKDFDEAFQNTIKNQIKEVESLVSQQFEYLEDISSLCCNNLPELTEMNAIVKHGIQTSISNLEDKIDNNNTNLQADINAFKSDVITQFLNIFNQISFVAEQEEILDFIQEKHSDLITILSHIVTTVQNVEQINDNVSNIDYKVDALRDEIQSINNKISSIISSEADIDYAYSLQDLELDIANLRLVLNEMKTSQGSSQGFEDLIRSTNDVYQLVESIKQEFPKFEVDEFKKDFEALTEDIVSISTRTNKLILASDESYKTLQDNLQDFKLVINDLDERTRNFAEDAGIHQIDDKLHSINTMIQNGAKTNQVFNQVFEYLAEWVDKAGEQISTISDKVETLDDIGQIKVMLQDLKSKADDSSESEELIEALGNIFDKQAKKINSLEAKLDKLLVESTINNQKNKIDMTPFEDTLNRFLIAIDDKMSLQQVKIKSLETKLEDVMSLIDPKDTAQLTKKVGGMDRQIAKLNKSIEKIASHVIEK